MLPSELPEVKGVVACDTETSGLFVDDGATVSVVSVAWFEPSPDGGGWDGVHAYAWPFDQGTRDKLPAATLDLEVDPNLGEGEWMALLAWLGRRRLVFQNAKFDLHVLREGTRHWSGVDLEASVAWDTMLASKVLDPREPTSLKPTAERLGLTGGGERDAEIKLKEALKQAHRRHKQGLFRYDLLQWSQIEEYATQDADLTLRLWQTQQERLAQGEGDRRRIDFMLEVMKVLYRMECRGIGFDVVGCQQEAEKLRRRVKELKAELPFNPTVPGAKQFFFGPAHEGGLGLLPFKVTEKGSPQLDDEVQAKLVKEGVKWAAEYQEVRRLEVALSMWYEGYPSHAGADGRLRTSFQQIKVKSGRMSVERINLQAIPKEDKTIEGVRGIKSLVRAKEGYELWNLDIAQAELRVATKYAGCKLMTELLAQGADLHGITTTEIFKIEADHPDWPVKRDIAKRLTFGGIFQIGPKTFQATLAKLAGIYLPLGECERMVWRWRDLYPEFGLAYRRAERIAAVRGWVRLMPGTPYEERSYFGEHDYPNTGWSRIVQGSLALFNQIWLVETEKNWPGLLVLNVHDSQVLEIPREGASRWSTPEKVAWAVAEQGAEVASGLFKTAMKIDYGQWGSKQKWVAGEDTWSE